MWWLILFVLALGAGFGAFFGAPYVPTHRRVINQALKLINLKPGGLLLDLGAGDGRLLKAAAGRGWRAVGYELNPIFWLIARVSTWRVRALVQLKMNDYLRADWPPQTSVIYIFSSARAMTRLAEKLKRWPAPVRVVSYGFALPGNKPVKTTGGFLVYELN